VPREKQFARGVLFFRATGRYPEAGISRGGFVGEGEGNSVTEEFWTVEYEISSEEMHACPDMREISP